MSANHRAEQKEYGHGQNPRSVAVVALARENAKVGGKAGDMRDEALTRHKGPCVDEARL